MKTLTAVLFLALAPAEGPPPPEGAPQQEEKDAPAEEREAELQRLRAEREKLVEQRDAARVRANTYVLPKDKLEVIAKQEEIDRIDARIAELEKATK